jgi:hypothetical protein
MPSQNWFCAQNNVNPNYYLYDYNEQYQTPVWTDDLDFPIWSKDSSKVIAFVVDKDLQEFVTVMQKGGDTPAHRPPL